MAATTVLDALDTYGKARTAYGIALQSAADQRESLMTSLGANITMGTGKVLTPEQAGKALGPQGSIDLSKATITTGATGGLAAIAQEGVGKTAQDVESLAARGLGEGGLVGQARLVDTSLQAQAKQDALLKAAGDISKINAPLAAKRMAAKKAKAGVATARGVAYSEKGGA